VTAVNGTSLETPDRAVSRDEGLAATDQVKEALRRAGFDEYRISEFRHRTNRETIIRFGYGQFEAYAVVYRKTSTDNGRDYYGEEGRESLRNTQDLEAKRTALRLLLLNVAGVLIQWEGDDCRVVE